MPQWLQLYRYLSKTWVQVVTLLLHRFCAYMMTSSNGNIFRVTGHLCGEFPGEFPTQRPVTRSFDVFFYLYLNKQLIKQSWGRWFETLSPPLWRHCNCHVSFLLKRSIKDTDVFQCIRRANLIGFLRFLILCLCVQLNAGVARILFVVNRMAGPHRRCKDGIQLTLYTDCTLYMD